MSRPFVFIMVVVLNSYGWAQSNTATLPTNEPATEETKAEVAPVAVPAGTTSTAKKEVERIEVTGSHIKRIDVEGVSPVQTLTRKELDQTGSNSVADVLRDTSANSFGSTREASGSNAAGVAHISLRGLGATNTLVLLNGQRLPSDAVTGAVDLNLIPMAAVERVEILKDGASAIYGSDALGGVVNIITRKDFTGSEIGFTTTQPEQEGGTKKEINLVNGINRKNLSMVNVVQYRKNDRIFSRDRAWSNNGVSSIGSPGSYRNAGDTWLADSNCPTGQVQRTPSGDLCSFKFSDYSSELPDLEQLSVLSETNVEVNGRTKLKARIGGTQKAIKWSFAPAPGTFVIPAAVAAGLGPNGGPLPGTTPGKDVQVRYRLTELGTRDTEVQTKAYNILLGGTRDLGNDWELELNTGHNRVTNRDEGVRGYALTEDLNRAIENGTFNPFAPEGQKGSLESARYKPLETTTSQLTTVDMKTSGPVAELGGRPVGLAVGTTFTFQQYEDKFDDRSVAGDVFGNAGSSGGGLRETRALFSELSLPVSSKLEFQLAGRYDHYSDFGSTVNPKAAFLFHATPSLLIRASAGTGFKAPLMQDLYAATSAGFPTFVDEVSCKREQAAGGATPSCLPQQYSVTSSGNKGLKEERSVSYNVGAIFEPNQDFSFGTDVFLTKLNNVVGIDYDDAMRAEAQGIDLASSGVIVHRDANGYIDTIEAPQQNLSAQEVSGVDIAASYRISKFKLANGYSRLLYFKEEGYPGIGLRDKLGENGRPAWRNTATVTYTPGERHDLSLSAMTIAGHDKTLKEQGRLAEYTSLDLQYAYKFKGFGVFTAGIKNIAGATPPLDDTRPTRPLDQTIYDQVGRQYYTGYKATF